MAENGKGASDGLDHLDGALEKTGGIILMSHMGNWEVAAHLLKQKDDKFNILLYMGIGDKEEIERIQKEDLQDSGIEIIGADRDGGSPFDIMKGIQFLKSGGLVSLTGDVVWKKDQRTVPVEFLGHVVRLPEIPYLFALLSGAPLFILFTFRMGKKQYHFSLSEPIFLKAPTRAHRSEVIRQSAQTYADLLEQALHQHPFEWYHFESFLGPKIEK